MPFLSQITDLLGNTIVPGSTIQINLWNIFCRKLQGTEVAKNKWEKKNKNYPRNMIILCNHRYSRSLKLTPDHNRAAQWNSMGDMLFIFFSPVFYTRPSDCICFLTSNRLLQANIYTPYQTLQKPSFIYAHLWNSELLPKSHGLVTLQSASLAHGEASPGLGGVARWSCSTLLC